ncbi:MAG: MYXO-CTERM sorting domain-containing protein, partial [Myxococcales bacterium]|nr:MYXO-CTERM sorting domain-containing protein [Myxococcales bacterium]
GTGGGGPAGVSGSGAPGAGVGGEESKDEGGCGCQVPGSSRPAMGAFLAMALGAAASLRQRRRR